MAKTKKTEKSKKPSHSDKKAPESALSKMFNSIVEKVVPTQKAASGKAKPAGKSKTSQKDSAVSAAATQTVEPSVKDFNPAIAAQVAAQVGGALTETTNEDEEVILTDAEGRRYCRASDCDQVGLVDGYCRYHYLLYWKKIQIRKKILADGKLERYIEELTGRYIDKFVELLRKDLRTEKDFLAAVHELELDDSTSSAQDEDEAKTYIEEISGVATEAGRDDEGF